MSIKEISQLKEREYGDEYKKWCLENPGRIMNGLSSKQDAAHKIGVGCETIEEIEVLERYYRRLSKLETKVNGFIFYADACKDILELLKGV